MISYGSTTPPQSGMDLNPEPPVRLPATSPFVLNPIYLDISSPFFVLEGDDGRTKAVFLNLRVNYRVPHILL
jgi:hypothetical protein